MKIEAIAMICHEANRALCLANGDASLDSWFAAGPHQRDSMVAGVEFRRQNPQATPQDQHDKWMAHKAAEGWTYGPVKDAVSRTHPCMLPYEQLPAEQRAKDVLFMAISSALLPMVAA